MHFRSSSSHLDDYQSDDDDDYEDGETQNHRHPEQFSVVQRISVVQRKTAEGDQVKSLIYIAFVDLFHYIEAFRVQIVLCINDNILL